jgi:hypothetical protein
MIILAILATIGAALWTVMVLYANGMASSPQAFQGGGSIALAWGAALVLWIAWAWG